MRLARKPTRSATLLAIGSNKRKGFRFDFCRDRIHKVFRVLSRKYYHQMAPLSRRDRTPAYSRILSRQS